MLPRTRPPSLWTFDPIVMNIPCFNLLLAAGTPVSAARAGWVHVALFVVGEPRCFLPFGVRRAQTNKNL
jgi:hypothetical protein